MARGLFQNVSGTEGVIRIVELGAVIGQFSKWRLDRMKVGEEDFGKLWRFQAELSYIQPVLFKDPDYVPKVFIVTGRDKRTRKDKQYRLTQVEGYTPVLNGRSLLMEGVELDDGNST